MKISYRLFLFLIPVLLVSCDPNRVYEFNYELEDDTWSREDTLIFDFRITDTATYHNLYINVRNTAEYPYSNLYLFLTIKAPNGKFSVDTVECVLADKKGKWLGNGSVTLFDNQILYKKNIRFPVKGIYRIKYEQAMRTAELKFIRNIGFRLEKATKNTPS